MLRIQGAVILVLSILVAVNGLQCYQSCTGSNPSTGVPCPSSAGTAMDTAITCDPEQLQTRCLKWSTANRAMKFCGVEGYCKAGYAMAKGIVEVGSDPAQVAEYKTYECYE
ncbi:MAG: hypothetical protein ACPIOQ_51675, partial [Promethearchaeia archaeon]